MDWALSGLIVLGVKGGESGSASRGLAYACWRPNRRGVLRVRLQTGRLVFPFGNEYDGRCHRRVIEYEVSQAGPKTRGFCNRHRVHADDQGRQYQLRPRW